ncbi:MAG: LacI family DNA-binding transcriptional regulator [Anaerotignum sp.]|nr:LacI family DNA-binding transcriptional regulator [Anaerotignum sp.]
MKKEIVLSVIEETGFKPNELARALFKKSSKIIGVIVPNIEDAFFGELARAIEEEAYQNNYRILLCNSQNNTEKELLNIQTLSQLKADGIIIMTNSEDLASKIGSCNIPFVILDRKIEGLDEIAFIEADHYKGGRMAMEHLIRCGCRNIVCMRGPQKFSSGQLRFQGYQDVCREHSLQEQWLDCDYDYEEGLRVAKLLLAEYPDVDGILACNDMVAIATYKVLLNKGLRVPEDVQLIGFDNIRFSRLFAPEFSTIIQPIREMGTLATQVIVRHANGEQVEKENVFDVSLVERQTTKHT